MNDKPIELTEAEWTVIKAVWDSEPCTAPAIQEKLFKQTEWTYSTVRTLMDRMVTKGLLQADKEKNVTLYHTAVTRAQAQRGELLYALKHAFNGALTPMVQCLLDTNDVSRAELDQLKQLIAAHEKSRGKGGEESVNPLLRWLTSPEWAHTVTALLHSLWQGALVALMLALLMRRLTNPLIRYRCALGALGVIVIAGLVTWGILNAPETTPGTISPAANDLAAASATIEAFAPNPSSKVVVVAPITQPAAQTNWTTWLALLWMTGAMVMLLRAGVKVAGAEKLRRSCQPLADENIATLVAEACRAVGLARKIRVAVTDKLTSPAVVGVLVPTLILPLSLFTTLTPTQIQFVLLHELAHIRRGDYLANLFQLFAEALLFFNPAVWWISHQIRREREACCDALAIELSGAPADYAKTLVRVAENILQPAPAAAPAFGDDGREPSSLADRVQRLLVPGYRPALRLTWRAMLTSLLVGMALLVLSAVGTRNTVGAILSTNQPPAAAPAQASLIPPTPSSAELTQPLLGDLQPSGKLVTNESSGLISASTNIQGREAISNRLNQIRLDRVYFEHQSLSEVIRELSEKTKQNDPEKKGINFILNPNNGRWIDPVTGLKSPSDSNELNSVLITLRRVTSAPLEHILDLMISGADKPIKYVIEDYGIVFEARGAESEKLFTREFDLPPKMIFEKVATNLAQPGVNRAASITNDTQATYQSLRDWFNRMGVNLDSQRGKAVFYKDRKGILLVRATLTELDTIEAAIVNLNSPSTVLANRTYQLEPTTVIQAIEAQIPQFKLSATTNVTAGLLALLESSGVDLSLPKTFYYNDRTGGLFVRATPEDLDAIESLLHVIGQQPPQVNIKAVFVEIPFGKAQPKELAKILEPITPESGITFTGILTASQFKAVLRALEKSSSAKFLAMPQVTTLSGRQAQIQVKDMKTIVSGVTAVVTNGMTNLVYQSEAMSFGPVLELLPTVSNDGYTVQMTLTPTFTEFLGYEDPKKLKPSLPAGLATLPLPIIRTRQMTTSANVWDGQTIVLGNFSDQMLDTPPDLKGAPKASGKKQSKQLLVFVTPTIIDPAGNPANKDMGVPSALPLR